MRRWALSSAADRAESVARPAGGVDHDALGKPARLLRCEPEALEHLGQLRLERLDGRIPLLHDAVEVRLAVAAPRLEAGIPDVERLQLAAQALLDQAGEVFDFLRLQRGDEQRLDLLLGDLALQVELPVDVRPIGRAERIDLAHRVKDVEELRVAGVRLAVGRSILDLVVDRIPEHVGVVDHRRRDLLADDPLHDLEYHPLLRQPGRGGVGVMRAELVAQPPVGDEPQALGEQALSARINQAVHADVVVRDVLVRGSESLGGRLLHQGGHAQDEAVHHPGARPGRAVPYRPLLQPLLQRVHRKVEQGEEGRLRPEQVLVDMGRKVDRGEQLIHGRDVARVQVERRGQLAAHLVEMAVHLLEDLLHALEGRVQGRRVGDEAFLAEGREGRGIAVFRPPSLGHLLDPAPDAVGMLLAVLRDQPVDRLADGVRRHGRLGRHPGHDQRGEAQQKHQEGDAQGHAGSFGIRSAA